MKYVCSFLLLIVFGAAQFGFAATANETFPVKALVGEDTPPTTPVIQSVTPVTSSQIDIVWSASTDNFGVSGYKLFRDMTQIATTTLTSYSDTGLTASTTYTYEVQAFDTGNNLSSTSAAVSTTTLPVVVPPPAPTSSTSTVGADTGIRSSSGRLTLSNFSLIPDTHAAVLRFDTRVPSRFALNWGRGDMYEGGYTATDIYRTFHETRITGLEPGTKYLYQLVGYNQYGQRYVLQTGAFTTLETPDLSPPQNVFGLTAYAIGDDVRLSWSLPVADDVAYVRVMRSPRFYPQDVYDGYFVFQGSETVIQDTGALRIYNTQYYTVFTVDHNGNTSSGAVVAVTKPPVAPLVGDEPSTVPETPPTSLLPTPLPPDVADVSVFEAVQYGPLQPGDVTVMQGDARYTLTEIFPLIAGEPLIVRIPYDAVPERLKSIILTFEDGARARVGQAYLLRLDSEGNYYEAHVSAVEPEEHGVVQIAVYDYEQAMVSYLRQGYISRASVQSNPEVLFPDKIVSYTPYGIIGMLVLLLLLTLFRFLIATRRRSDNDDGPTDVIIP